MFLFGSKKKTAKTCLVLSLESSHVRACFVTLGDHQKPYIIAEAVQSFEVTQSFQGLVQCLDKTLAKLFHTNPMQVDTVLSVLGAPWYLSRTYTFLRDEEAPFLFRERDVKKILKDKVSDFETELVEKHGFSKNALRVIEKNILHIGLNGYEVEEVTRTHVRRGEVTSYVSVAEETKLEALQSHIERFTHAKINFQTGTLVQSVVARDVFQYLERFLLVSLDGEQTELSLIHDGALIYGSSFPIGDNAFSKEALRLGLSKETLLSELKMLEQGSLQTVSSPLQQVLGLTEELWRQKFVASLEEILPHTAIPHQVVVLSKPHTFYWVQKALQDARNKHLSVSDTNLHAILMNAENLQSFVGSKILDPDLKLMMYASFTILK